MSFKTISVIGLGYIGLPTAAMFASRNTKVIGIDINKNIVDKINLGEIHIVEPDLDLMVASAVNNGFLTASEKAEPADAFLIAVPTPFKDSESDIPEPELKFVEASLKSIAPVIKKGDLIILESTCPVGTTEKVSLWLSELRKDLLFPHATNTPDINIAYCPERVLPGRVVKELIENDRIIGGMTKKCSSRALELYKIFVEGDCIKTDCRTAEMAKLTENSCRDVQIAFANELSLICDELNINVWELISLANRHPRINILQPGPGVGGHCIAVDPWFIINKSPKISKVIHSARLVNDSKPDWVISKVKDSLLELLQDNKPMDSSKIVIACFGLTFKADIDDLRESPAMKIASEIGEFHKGEVLAVDPNVDEIDSIHSLELCSIDHALEVADIGVMLVDHKEFKAVKPRKNMMLIDTRGIWV